MSNLKAFAVGDSDIYAAETAEQALALANDLAGDDAFELDEVTELVDADLDKEYPEFDEDERPTGGTTTIRFWLSEATEPGWLAVSEW
jgi:hypothetical protein